MFEIDPSTTWIDPAAGPITALVQSLNTPLVAAGEHPAEDVRSWIVTRQGTGGLFDVLVFFHLTQSNKGVVFHWSEGSVAPTALAYTQEEALAFCESMGFMMDDLDFAGAVPERRGELLQTLPPFVQDLSTIVKEEEEVVESGPKKVDPLEDFVRMKQARAEAGQMGTGEFLAAQGEPVHEMAGGPEGGPVFDPNNLAPRADAPHILEGGEPQIEITEVEGLELIPEGEIPMLAVEPVPVPPGPEPSEPPVVMGSVAPPPAAMPPMDFSSVSAPPPSMETEPGMPPPRRVREKTPAGDVPMLDPEFVAPVAAAAAPTGPVPGSAPVAEVSIDDMLADVGAPPSDDGDDLSSELDAILDRVENTNPPVPEPPEPAGIAAAGAAASSAAAIPMPDGSDDGGISISLDGDAGDDDDDPMKLLDALVGGQSDGGNAAKPAQVQASSRAADADGPSPLDALEAAWMDDGASKANGSAAANGAARPGAGAPATSAPIDIATEDLARFLAML